MRLRSVQPTMRNLTDHALEHHLHDLAFLRGLEMRITQDADRMYCAAFMDMEESAVLAPKGVKVLACKAQSRRLAMEGLLDLVEQVQREVR